MANSNGKIYVNTNTTPHVGISIADIQTVFGTSLYNDIGGLITHININKWAKYKPVEHNSPAITTDANRKAALHGMPNIPVYTSAVDLTSALRSGITPGSHWPRTNPSTWYRLLDFDGYLHHNHIDLEWGAMGVQSAQALNFPFAGRLWTSDDIIRPYSEITNATLQPSDPERTPTGLLYPSDWSGTTLPFPDWYFGVLCAPVNLPASGSADLWIVTSDTQIKNVDPDDDILTHVPFTLNETSTPLGLGNYRLYPIMCLNSLWNGVGTPHFVNCKNTWSGGSGGPGSLVLIDGYSLPVQLTAGGAELEITFSLSGTTANFSVRNTIRLPITFSGNQFFGYLVAYAAGRTDEEAVEDACDEWIDDGTEHTTGVFNDNFLVGRYLDLMGAFRAANNNSSVIAGNTTVNFSVSVGASADGRGNPYNNLSEFYVCHYYAYQGTNPERRYDIIDQ